MMNKTIKKLLRPFVPQFILDSRRLPVTIENESFPGGHYYSVIPSLADVNTRADKIFNLNDPLDGIDLNRQGQVDTLLEFQKMSAEAPSFLDNQIRFIFDNNSFSYDDAPVLNYMLRKIKPARIIEIGCGYSSAVMLDTNDLYLDGAIVDFTFIDIDFSNLNNKLTEKDKGRVKLIEKPIQDIDLSIFATLQENDLLFVDSSHVSKVGSDLNTIIFKILPLLNPGVYIHFHDIRYPFEYPQDLINNKVFWNEAYLLRAFLMFNENFKMTFWLNYLLNDGVTNKSDFDFLPLSSWDKKFNNSRGEVSGAGGSLYLRKVK